jgi:hypothetical protein
MTIGTLQLVNQCTPYFLLIKIFIRVKEVVFIIVFLDVFPPHFWLNRQMTVMAGWCCRPDIEAGLCRGQ